ncbi:hypothetical protein CDAR_514151 [Caerostris darwini]|uniref:Uncharacterized protein n=1 Tax=Caerostris darwini TaxID=1538125 RepID=A0AAV4UMZ4_9ARAC|nr:hypothetical protein CDAR_514151 [Caerostris darwini]
MKSFSVGITCFGEDARCGSVETWTLWSILGTNSRISLQERTRDCSNQGAQHYHTILYSWIPNRLGLEIINYSCWTEYRQSDLKLMIFSLFQEHWEFRSTRLNSF